jgi:uncharacterized protein (TIGR03067 family)
VAQTFQSAAPCHVPKHSGSPQGPAGLEARDTAGLETCATSRSRRSAHQVHGLDSRPILVVIPNHELLTPNAFTRLTLEPMKLLRPLLTVVCVVACFGAHAGEQPSAAGKGAAHQPIHADLQLLQGTWEGVALGEPGSSKKSDSQATSQRKPDVTDLALGNTGVLGSPPSSETPPPPQEKITITITGNSFHFHRDTNFWFETTMTLPAGTNPKQLHATIKDCPTPSSIGQVVLAIFKIEDGILTIATEGGGDKAPKSFESTGNNGLTRYELRKVQPQKRDTPPPKTK